MPASERDVGVERSLHARAGCGWRAMPHGEVPRGLSTRARDAGDPMNTAGGILAVSPRARGMRAIEPNVTRSRHGLSTHARDAGRC